MKAGHKRLIRRLGLSLGTLLVLVTAIHLPPLGGWLGITGGHGGGCPFGLDHPATPEARLARQAATAKLRGTEPARRRPALGFTLDVTTAAEILRWSDEHQLGCTAKYRGALITCTQVPASALPAGAGTLGLTSAWFEVGANGTLSSIKTMRRDASVATVSATFATIGDAIATAGPVTARAGSAAPEVLGHGLLRQASIESRFTDYRAVIRATNMGKDFALSEEYSTLVD